MNVLVRDAEQEGQALVLEEFSGTIKWFDLAKRFGFIVVPDEKDILLHLTTLVASGLYQQGVEYMGAKITGTRMRAATGFQCVSIKSLELDAALQGKLPQRRIPTVVSKELEPQTLEVKWFNKVRGFGFFAGPDNVDIFVHAEVFRNCGFDPESIRSGDWFLVVFGPKDGRPSEFTAVRVGRPE